LDALKPLILLCVITVAACSSAGLDCGVADDVSVIDEATLSNQAYYLVARVSGTHDKVAFFELYAQEPRFDECGRSAIMPLSSQPYERSQGYLKGLIVKDSQLEIVYTPQEQEGIDFLDARLPRQ
jgi:hypothetical protein